MMKEAESWEFFFLGESHNLFLSLGLMNRGIVAVKYACAV